MQPIVKATRLFVDSASPYVCNISSALFGREAFLLNTDLDPAAGGGGGGAHPGAPPGQPGADPGAGNTPPPGEEPKKLDITQAEFDRLFGVRMAAEKKKLETESARARATVEAELKALKDEKELAGKSQEERDRINGERARQAFERAQSESKAQIESANLRAETAEKQLKEERIAIALGTGLDVAKVYGPAREKAIKLFREDCVPELGEDGKIIGVSYAGTLWKNAAEAAAAFLKDNDYLASGGRPAGGGSRSPSAGGTQQDVFKSSAEENFAAGLSQPPKPVNPLMRGL
jgi:hypothetical protein